MKNYPGKNQNCKLADHMRIYFTCKDCQKYTTPTKELRLLGIDCAYQKSPRLVTE